MARTTGQRATGDVAPTCVESQRSTAAFDTPAPDWMSRWPRVAPHPTSAWTVGDGRRYGVLDPSTEHVTTTTPSADPLLPALGNALDNGELVAYRHHRRAVIRRSDGYVKVVRPQRVEGIVLRHERAAAEPSYASPNVVAHSDDGRIELSTMPGVSLHDTIRADAIPPADDIARLLANVASTDASTLPDASLDSPIRWIETVSRIEPCMRSTLNDIAAQLPVVNVDGDSFVHGDLHDKNIFVTHHLGTTRLGVIDLDGASRGAAEIDVANLAVHLELRAMQAGGREGARSATPELLIGAVATHCDLDQALVDDLRRHTWFRLACLYRCRPASRHLMPTLLERSLERQR